MKKRPDNKTPFMASDDFGRSLKGFTLNILVSDMQRAVVFVRHVLEAEFVYDDPDIAIAVKDGFQWLIHSDHTYDKHSLLKHISSAAFRGAGAEFRLHNGDPDLAAQRAINHGFTVFDGPRDQPDHGLREVHLIDQDGYIWVVDQPLISGEGPVV